MKKFFGSIALLVASVSLANAQTIAVDKAEEDGSRYIVTTDSRLGNLGDLGLKASVVNGKTDYFLNLTLTGNSVIEISKGRKLLLKLKNGEILMLENTADVKADDNKAIAGTTNSTFYYVSLSYKVSEADLKKIANGEVTKVRIDRNYGYRDVEIANNNFSSKVKTYFEDIQNAMKTKKTFTSDF